MNERIYIYVCIVHSIGRHHYVLFIRLFLSGRLGRSVIRLSFDWYYRENIFRSPLVRDNDAYIITILHTLCHLWDKQQ